MFFRAAILFLYCTLGYTETDHGIRGDSSSHPTFEILNDFVEKVVPDPFADSSNVFLSKFKQLLQSELLIENAKIEKLWTVQKMARHILNSSNPWACKKGTLINNRIEVADAIKTNPELIEESTAHAYLKLASNNDSALAQVAFRYPYSKASQEALSLLLASAIDRFDPLEALIYSRALTRDFKLSELDTLTLNRLLVAYGLSGQEKSRQALLAEFPMLSNMKKLPSNQVLEVAAKLSEKAKSFSEKEALLSLLTSGKEEDKAHFDELLRWYSPREISDLEINFKNPCFIPLLSHMDPPLILSLMKEEGDVFSQTEFSKILLSALKQTFVLANEVVRREVVKSIGNLEKNAHAMLPVLITALTDSDPEVRRNANVALDRIGDVNNTAIPELTKALNSPDLETRISAIHALGSFGVNAQASVPELIRALSSSDEEVRTVSLYALNRIAMKLPTAELTLIKALKDPDVQVRRNVNIVLSNMGEKAHAAVPELINTLDDSDTEVRCNAINALSGIGEKAEAAVPELVKALNDSDVNVRIKVINALGNIGNKAQAAVPALIKLLSERNDAVRESVLVALGEMRDKAEVATPEVFKLLDDRNDRIRILAIKVIVKISEKNLIFIEQLSNKLIKILTSDIENSVRAQAADSLGRMGDKAKTAIPELTKRAHFDPDEFVRVKASIALGKINGDSWDD